MNYATQKLRFDATVYDGTAQRMTGEESYPVIGDAMHQRFADAMMRICKGTMLHADCLEKAVRMAYYGPFNTAGTIALGALTIDSEDFKSTFGFAYNPPLEMHAWNIFGGEFIIDLSLPGAILRGMNSRDEVGPFLVGREPAILAVRNGQEIPQWLHYEVKEIHDVRDIIAVSPQGYRI